MPRPPRKKRINTKVECDAFGCRPKTTIKNEGKFNVFGGGPSKPPSPKPVPRYDWGVEKMPVKRSFDQPQDEVMLDVGIIEPGKEEQKLFTGSYQDAQKAKALAAAAQASKTFTPANFPKFQEASRQSLIKGGADERTISPTSKPGENIALSKKPISFIKEQALRQQFGPDYDIAKEGKVMSRTRYRTDPKTGKREPVRKLMYDNQTITDINLYTGRAKITDLSTGKTKYQKTPEIEVEKKEIKESPKTGSIVELQEKADVPEKEIEKARIKAASEASKKPGYFSEEAIRARKRKRRRSRYPQGSR